VPRLLPRKRQAGQYLAAAAEERRPGRLLQRRVSGDLAR
jgi:hypothetical protein